MTIKIKTNKEVEIDDTQTVVSDISQLHSQFVGPIDRLRSLSKPAPQAAYTRVPQTNQSTLEFITQNNFSNLEINPDRPLESRVHAFYRMIGFPVMASDGSFYNPGFEPNSSLTIEKKEKVNQALLADQNLQNIMFLRERAVQTRRSIFVKQNLDSSAYALALRYVRSFSEFFNKELGPLEIDKQTYTIQDRIFETDRIGSTTNFNQASHILRPFIVNHLIADTVMPADNLICVPFLQSKEDTKIDLNKFLLRPSIEFILRQRLQQDSSGVDFLNEVKRIISQESADDSERTQNIRNTISVITGLNDLTILQNNSSFDDIISKVNSVEFSTINMLVKTIKVVIEQLDRSLREFDTLKALINFEPIPAIEGPEFGSNIRTVGGGTGLSDFEQKIGLLKILDLNAQQQQKIVNERLGGGSELFATSVVSVTQKNYSEEIAKLTRERNNYAGQASQHMANIEKIVGEVSGLGLIDVLAVYTALWSIPIEALIGFLDDTAFNRLWQYNPELRTSAVQARHDGTVLSGLDVLASFEDKLFSILQFADKIFDQKRSSPANESGGDIR